MSKALNKTGQLCVAVIDQFSVAVYILIGIPAVIGAIMNPHYLINFAGGWLEIASGGV